MPTVIPAPVPSELPLTFPNQLARVAQVMHDQEPMLRQVAALYADAIQAGGLIHVYANGHSRMATEEMVVRMGAMTGFHPLMASALTTFTDVVGNDGLRMCQAVEKVEGLGKILLAEAEIGPKDVFLVLSATGQTHAAVDFALEAAKQYPDNPLVVLASIEQSKNAAPKHSSGKTLYHVAKEHKYGFHLDNAMPMGDLSTPVSTPVGDFVVCPLSSVGGLTVVQSLNELTIRELGRRGYKHFILQNMHLGGYGVNYDEWLLDQRRRYARAMSNPQRVEPKL